MKKRIGVVIGTVLICSFGLEWGLRAIGRTPTNMAEGIADQYGDSFRLKRNITKTVKFPAFTYTVCTNAFGFRDAAVGAKDLAGRPFYVFLGASDVFGNGVDYSDSFVGVFAKEAARRGIEVLNLAVGGHYFLDQEDLLKDFMTETGLTPAKVFYCVNALHIPKFDRRNRNIIVKSGYVIDRKGWQIAYLRLMAGNVSSAFCFVRDGIRRIQEKYFHYELTEKSPEFLQIYDRTNPIRGPERVHEFYDHLAAFESFCRERSIELAYVYMPLSDSFRLAEMVGQIGADPARYDASFYEDLMRTHCEQSGVPMANPRTVLEQAYAKGEALRFKLDPHFNAFANKAIGLFLIDALF